MDLLTSALSHWQGAVAVIVVLGGLIFFHELGHFSLARILGIGVRTFSLGFGPRLWSRRMGKTDYCLSLVPLGGYVSLVGEGGEEDVDPDDSRKFSEQEAFFARPAWQRMLVIAAGPVANFILAWIIYAALAFFLGASFMMPEIGKVLPNTPAATAGFEANDLILSVNGKPIVAWPDLTAGVIASQGGELDVVVLRNGAEHSVRVTPAQADYTTIFGEKVSGWQLGLQNSGRLGHTPLGPIQAVGEGAHQTWRMLAFTVEGLVKLFQNVVPLEAVGGPIMIAQAVGQQAQEGFVNVLLLAALISVNLGLLNLLPIPVLDGGHLVFLCFEMLLRRPVSPTVQEYSFRLGVVLLVGLMVFATWNDIVRLVS